MKTSIYFFLFILIQISCNSKKEESRSVDSKAVLKEVQSKKSKLKKQSDEIELLSNKNVTIEKQAVASLNNLGVLFDSNLPNKIVDTLNGIEITSGKIQISLKNKLVPNDETANQKYHFKGFDRKSNLCWIYEENWEDSRDILVNVKTAKQTVVTNDPILSIDRNFIICKQNDCFQVFEDCKTGFSVYSTKNGKVELLTNVVMNNYYVHDLYWVSNTDFVIVVRKFDMDSNPKNQYYKVKIN